MIIKQNFRREFCHWVQLREEEGQSLELLEQNPIPTGLGFKHIGCNGHTMRNKHVDSHTKLEDYVDEANCKFGGSLSIRFPGQSFKDGTYPTRMKTGDNVRPLMLIGKDESIFYQFLFLYKSWHGPSGEDLILPKGEGKVIMHSALTAPIWLQLTPEDKGEPTRQQVGAKRMQSC